MASPLLVEAVAVALGSGAMLAVALGAVAANDVSGSALRHRAIHPGVPWRASVALGARAELVAASLTAPFLALRRVPRVFTGASDHGQTAQRNLSVAASIAVVAVLGAVAASLLTVTGHASLRELALLLAVAGYGLFLARSLATSPAERGLLARRGPHLMVTAAVSEVGVILSVALSIGVVLHTSGLSLSPVDIGAVAILTRLAVRLAPTPSALVVADMAMLTLLLWLDIPILVAVACAVVWRVAASASLMVLAAAAQHAASAARTADAPQDSTFGRGFHRLFFTVVGVLPGSWRARARQRVFETMFSLSPDPWRYDEMPYEARKQVALVASVGTRFSILLEFGAADGHNLRAFAALNPEAMLLGTDVSRAAVATARSRSHGQANIGVVHISDDESWEQLEAHRGRVDVLVLAEVLYYLGSDRSMSLALAPVRRLLSPSARVVMLHGAGDAYGLHARARRCLGLTEVSTAYHDDPERPFVLSHAHGRAHADTP